MAETALSERSVPEPDGWERKKTEGLLREEIALRFDDGSKLTLTVEVRAGSRAFASAAGQYLERLRAAIEDTK